MLAVGAGFYSVLEGGMTGHERLLWLEKNQDRNGVALMPGCLQDFPCTYRGELFFRHIPSKLNWMISMNSVCYKSDTVLNLLPFLLGAFCFYRARYGYHL
jgi:hypothetical protein